MQLCEIIGGIDVVEKSQARDAEALEVAGSISQGVFA